MGRARGYIAARDGRRTSPEPASAMPTLPASPAAARRRGSGTAAASARLTAGQLADFRSGGQAITGNRR